MQHRRRYLSRRRAILPVPEMATAFERVTYVVPNRLAERRVRDELAAGGSSGHAVTGIAGLASRLAGGLRRSASATEVLAALRDPPASVLTSLRDVALLPGFGQAAARTLFAAWQADLDLQARADVGGRWSELAGLERHVEASLPHGVLLPPRLVEAARARVALASTLTGRVVLERLTDLAPLYRGLMAALAAHVPVTWRGASGERPTWLPASIDWVAPSTARPRLRGASCADPDHEALEAIRWAHELLANGRRAADIAIAAVDPTAYDEALAVYARGAGIPLHSAHGVPVASTPLGQVLAALADLLARGVSQTRVRRLLATARAAQTGPLALVPETWADELDAEAFLQRPVQWERALRPLAAREPEQAAIIMRLVVDLALGLAAAERIGDRWLDGRARSLWRLALTAGQAAVLERSLATLRVVDETDPAIAVVWGPASALIAWPRPFTRLVGLSGRAWPRRGNDEDPLLPERLRHGARLRERNTAREDSEAFVALTTGASSELIASWPRRGSDGRRLTRSPLIDRLPGLATEVAVRSVTRHASCEGDRRAARPRELATDLDHRMALTAFRSRFSASLTSLDGLVRERHPAVVKALEGKHSATSLRSLLDNPHAFIAKYALGWRRPEPQTEVLALDAAALGTLLHEVLRVATEETAGERSWPSDTQGVQAAVRRAVKAVSDEWEATRPVPPWALWRAVMNEITEWASWSLALDANTRGGGETYAELEFGHDSGRGGRQTSTPWDPASEVLVPGTGLRVRGVIDHLDVDRTAKRVRVIDYKSGKPPREPAGLDGGTELQRTLYTVVVRQLLGADWEVEALLVHPRQRQCFRLEDPDACAATLTEAIRLAVESLIAGNVVAGPGLGSPFAETAIAFPAYGTARYLETKGEALSSLRRELEDVLRGVA